MSATRNDLNQIGFLLGRAYYSYIRLLEKLLAEAGLNAHCKPGMGNLLFALFREDDRTIGEVGSELQLARATMTGMVSRMRKAGLITEERDPRDARAIRIRLTSLARSLESRCHHLAKEVEQTLCQDLDQVQRDQLRETLAVVTRTINRELCQSSSATGGRTMARSETSASFAGSVRR